MEALDYWSGLCSKSKVVLKSFRAHIVLTSYTNKDPHSDLLVCTTDIKSTDKLITLKL